MGWTNLADPPHFPGIAVPVGTLIYLLNSDDSSWQSYDTTNDSYTTLTPPDPFPDLQATNGVYDAVNGTVVLFGCNGNTGDTRTDSYDIGGDSWSSLTGDPNRGTFHQAFGLGRLDRRVIVAGGYEGGSPSDVTTFYDLDTDTWTLAAPMPGVLAACNGDWVTVSTVDQFVLLGGDDGSSTPTKYVWDDNLNDWVSGFTVDFDSDAAGDPAVVAIDATHLVVLGGNGSAPSVATWLHDADADTWTALDDCPFDSQKPAAVVAGLVYAFAEGALLQAAAVLDPGPVTAPIGITAELIALDDLSTVLATLENTHSRSWVESLVDPGAHTISVQNDDPDWAAFAHGMLVNYSYKGVLAVTGICERSVNQVIAALERDQRTVWSGRLHIALLERGLVFPTGGTGRYPIEEDRVFNWTAPEYDDSTWIPATAVDTVGGAKANWANVGIVPFGDGFPDDTAEVLWSAEGTDTTADSGPRFSRQIISPALDSVYQFYFLLDNLGEAYIDGQLVASVGQSDGLGFTRATQATVQLSAGNHVLAIRCENLPIPPTNTDDPAEWAWAYYLSNANGVLGDLIDHSDSATCVLYPGYPAPPPGMTPGQVIRLVVEEAQARGSLTWITLDFDDVNDTDGNPWTTDTDISTKVGTDLLTFILRELGSTYIDVYMVPGTLTLQAWALGARPGLGSSVVFTYGTNILELVYEREGPPVTDFLIRWANGWTTDSLVPGLNDPIETLLGLGGLTSLEEVSRVADQQLAIFGQIRAQVRLTPESVGSDDAYVDYVISDVVTVPTEDMLGTTDSRVIELEVSEDGPDAPNPERVQITPILEDKILGDLERAFLNLKKMTNGTGLGRIRPAQPVVPVYIPRAFTHDGVQDTRCVDASTEDPFGVAGTYPSDCGVADGDGVITFDANGTGPCGGGVTKTVWWAAEVSGGVAEFFFEHTGTATGGAVNYEIPALFAGGGSVADAARGTMFAAADDQSSSFSEIEIGAAVTGGNHRQFGVGFGNGLDFVTGIGFRYYFDGSDWNADLVLNDPVVSSGLDTILVSDTSLAALAPGDVLRFARTGADIIGQLNGVDVLTYTLTGGELTDPGASVTDASFHMATNAALAVNASVVTLYTNGDLAVRRFTAGTTVACA